MVVSFFYMLHICSTRKFGGNDCHVVNFWLAHIIQMGGEKPPTKANCFFCKCRKNKWRKQLKLNKPGAQLNFTLGKLSIMTDPLGSRIPGTVFLRWFQCHWFSSAVTIYLLFVGVETNSFPSPGWLLGTVGWQPTGLWNGNLSQTKWI